MYDAKELGITEQELWERGGEAKTLEHFEQRVYLEESKVIRCLYKSGKFDPNLDKPSLRKLENENCDYSDSELENIQRHVKKIVSHIKK